jgi:hypothetical protein
MVQLKDEALQMMFSVQLLTDDLSGEVMVAPSKKLEDLIHLAELCVDLLQQNEEHYAEVGLVQFLVVSVSHHILH